jgi:hypothetical protein
MEKRIGILLLACLWINAVCLLPAVADTPTATVTATPTVTPTSTAVPAITVVSLSHNRFNPLAGESVQVTGLRPDHGQVSVTVYNTAGLLVRKVADHVNAANVTPSWDGKNEQGQVVASGVYLVMVTGNLLHKRFRIAVLK